MLISFLFAAGIALLLFGALKIFKDKHTLIFKISSLIPITLIIIRMIYRAVVFKRADDVLQGLPLQMCGIASILLPIAAFTKKQLAFDITYFFSLPGTVAAILLDTTASTNLADFEMWAFLVPHIMYAVLPIYFISFKYMKPRLKNIKFVLLSVTGIITAVHFVNLIINAILGPMTVNFIFTIFPGDSIAGTGEFQELPVLGSLFHLCGDTPYFYLLPLLPVMLILFCLLALPFISKAGYAKFFSRIKKLFRGKTPETAEVNIVEIPDDTEKPNTDM